jgi:hypothetical protein
MNLIRFENRIGRTVLPTPPVSVEPTASPCCPAPHPAADDRAPVASRPTCQPHRPASRRPRRSPLSRGNAPPARAAAGPLRHRRHAAALLHTAPGPPLSPSLSPTPPPRGVHPSAPPRRFSLKRSRRPPAEFFFKPRTPFVSSVHARAPRIRPNHLSVLLTSFPPSEPLLRAGLCPRVTAVCPPSGELLPSCSIPQLTAASSPPGLPRAAGPLHACRRPPELPRPRLTPFAPPHRQHTVPVRPCPLLLARHLLCASLEISDNTLPSASRH